MDAVAGEIALPTAMAIWNNFNDEIDCWDKTV